MSSIIARLMQLSNDISTAEKTAKKTQEVRDKKDKRAPTVHEGPSRRNEIVRNLLETGQSGAGIHQDQNRRVDHKRQRGEWKKKLRNFDGE